MIIQAYTALVAYRNGMDSVAVVDNWHSSLNL